jgi:glycosyltransferase involved in cell wall biosynthesis
LSGAHSIARCPISSASPPSGEKPVILQIVPTLEAGGAERTTVDVASALAREGYTALVGTRGGRMVSELASAGGRWVNLPVHKRSPKSLVVNVFNIRRIIRERNVALIHARSRAPAWSAFIAARQSNIPFVTTYHGIYNAHNSVKRFYNSVMARGDAVIANSEWTARHIASEYRFRPKHLQIIPRGVDLARFAPERIPHEHIEALRADWGVRDGERIILLPGRLTRWKGQAVFIRALGKMKRAGQLENIKAILAGDAQGRAEYQSELEELIFSRGLNTQLTIAGHVADMPAAYLAADIVVSASTDPEAFGRVAAEAGAMGRPVIATDHGGSREIILPNRSGVLVEPDDPEALAAALTQLLAASPERLAQMGAEARAHVSSHFTVERMCADTIALYRELLENRL